VAISNAVSEIYTKILQQGQKFCSSVAGKYTMPVTLNVFSDDQR